MLTEQGAAEIKRLPLLDCVFWAGRALQCEKVEDGNSYYLFVEAKVRPDGDGKPLPVESWTMRIPHSFVACILNAPQDKAVGLLQS